jgi:hypothetical protein
MKNIPLGKIILYLIIAFVVVSIWKDPKGSADVTGTFLSSVGHFFGDLGHRTSTFLKNI